MDATKKLGTLEKVPLRHIWGHEALDFTPWLAEKENIRLLGETLGIDIEIIAQECFVGQFRSDIHAKEVNTGKFVLIENQLERTDHSHLGQIITYASGLDSGIIIWIAPEIREEHRAAIDWLNRTTNDNTNFFAVEIELWRIGDSLPAPKFNIVCEPNEWTKYIQTEVTRSQITASQSLSLDYWTKFKSFAESSGSLFRCSKPLPQTQFNILTGNSPFRISATIEPNNNRIKVLLWVSGRGDTMPKRDAAFRLLKENYSSLLDNLFGKDLVWDIRPSRGWDEVNISATYDPNNTETWEQQHNWLKSQLEKMVGFFNSNLKDLLKDEIESGEKAKSQI